MGGLLVDSREGIRRGGASGMPAVVPNKPDKSLLITAIHQKRHAQNAHGRPPAARCHRRFRGVDCHGRARSARRQGPARAASLRFRQSAPALVVSSGAGSRAARDPRPRSGTKPRSTVLSAPSSTKRASLPLGLASKRALIRRATFDLTGLPPTPEEIDAFLKDTSPKAFEKVVDRLLASPQYGERWGRHWLDVVRYADTAGCNSDFPVPDAWRYRNWVIDAFNRDKPYMDFLREQLAGDLLPAKDDEDRRGKIIATGYIAISRRFASSVNEHYLTIDDTVDNVGKAMLGLSVSCAHCHDHKFDAIPERDYFGLYGIFESTVYAFPGVETVPRPYDFEALGGPDSQKTLTGWENQIKDAYAKIRELRFGNGRNKPDAKAEDREAEERGAGAGAEAARCAARLCREAKAAATTPKCSTRAIPRSSAKRRRADFSRCSAARNCRTARRAAAAANWPEWITDPKNPLTARVMVNRIWEGHFGKGIVATPNDFGVRGEAPTHPELLDWLASRFAESGYSVKAMHRLIMLSRAYQLAAGDNAADFKKDPKNSYLWKFDRRRLEAEEIRDSLLAVSGQLDPTPGGRASVSADVPVVVQPAPAVLRRLRHQQAQRVPDAAAPAQASAARSCSTRPIPTPRTGMRNSSITALQALAFMNNEFVNTQADQFAVRVGMAYDDTPTRIRHAYQLAFGRAPAPGGSERRRTTTWRRRGWRLKTPACRRRQPRAALASYLHVLLASDEFLFVD